MGGSRHGWGVSLRTSVTLYIHTRDLRVTKKNTLRQECRRLMNDRLFDSAGVTVDVMNDLKNVHCYEEPCDTRLRTIVNKKNRSPSKAVGDR